MTELRETCYWLDDNDIIVRTCSGWDEFALANNGGEVLSGRTIGQPIWAFIKDDNTRMWVYALLQNVRVSGKTIIRPYRCDSPEEKRFMRMEVRRETDQLISLRHRIMRSEKISQAVNIVYQPKKFVQTRLQRCSICNRLHDGEKWLDIEEFIALYNRGTIEVDYTICTDCKKNDPSL